MNGNWIDKVDCAILKLAAWIALHLFVNEEEETFTPAYRRATRLTSVLVMAAGGLSIWNGLLGFGILFCLLGGLLFLTSHFTCCSNDGNNIPRIKKLYYLFSLVFDFCILSVVIYLFTLPPALGMMSIMQLVLWMSITHIIMSVCFDYMKRLGDVPKKKVKATVPVPQLN